AVDRDALRQFNCGGQSATSWRERAEIAADFVMAFPASERIATSVADIGCGDLKLLAMLRARGAKVDYVGFDLHPQRSKVVRFDARSEELPHSFDVGVALGVVEYLDDVPAFLSR